MSVVIWGNFFFYYFSSCNDFLHKRDIKFFWNTHSGWTCNCWYNFNITEFSFDFIEYGQKWFFLYQHYVVYNLKKYITFFIYYKHFYSRQTNINSYTINFVLIHTNKLKNASCFALYNLLRYEFFFEKNFVFI